MLRIYYNNGEMVIDTLNSRVVFENEIPTPQNEKTETPCKHENNNMGNVLYVDFEKKAM